MTLGTRSSRHSCSCTSGMSSSASVSPRRTIFSEKPQAHLVSLTNDVHNGDDHPPDFLFRVNIRLDKGTAGEDGVKRASQRPPRRSFMDRMLRRDGSSRYGATSPRTAPLQPPVREELPLTDAATFSPELRARAQRMVGSTYLETHDVAHGRQRGDTAWDHFSEPVFLESLVHGAAWTADRDRHRHVPPSKKRPARARKQQTMQAPPPETPPWQLRYDLSAWTAADSTE